MKSNKCVFSVNQISYWCKSVYFLHTKGDQSKMNQSAKDWCKVAVCATRWLGRVIHLIENRDKAVRIKLKYFQGGSYLLGLLGFSATNT